nr:hypothetical protein [Lachnospiraceae bacterium]
MRKKINQLAKGSIEEVQARIRLSEKTLNATVPCGQSAAGRISLSSENGIPFRGLAYSDDERVELLQDAFAGQQVTLNYVVHGEDEKEDTVLQGHFSLVTNTGDIELPYRFIIGQSAGLDTPLPASLPELAQLADTQPELVHQLYVTGAFAQFPFLRDDSLKALLTALKDSPDSRLAQEEFLVACGAKQPVKLTVQTTPISVFFKDSISRGELLIRRSGSGYCVITTTASAPFIRLPRERWTSADFKENELRIPVYFMAEHLHAGRNLGEVLINTGREEFRIPVTVVPERTADPEQQRARQLRRARLQLSRSMVTLYAGQDPPYNIESLTMKHLEACEAGREPEVAEKLLCAELCRETRRRAEEKETLEQIRAEVQRNRMEKVTQYLWFLYLEEEMEKGDRLSDSFLRLLYRLKDEEAGRVELLPLLMRCDSEWAEHPDKCFLRIRELFRRGQFPLILKLETVKLLNNNPDLLTELDSFTLQLLTFGARFNCWKKAVADTARDLLVREKAFRPGCERLALLLYRCFPDKEMLTALLTVLLRREKPSPRYLEWYEKGIREDVRLAELYEYYLTALPDDYDDDIPQMVQLYYTYNSPRSRSAQRSLYRYILTHYEPDTQMYRLYEKQIQTYAMDQLLLGDVRDSETVFYEKMFIPQVLDSRMAVVLAEYVYTMHLTLSNRSIDKILVIYGELKEPFVYPVRDGEAYIPVFTPRCRLLFLDKNGDRYVQSVFRRKKLMEASRELMETLRRLAPGSLPLKLLQCQKAIKGELNEWEARDLVQRFTEWNELSEAYREKLIFSLVKRRNLGTAENAALLKELRRSPYLDAQAGALLAESLLLQGDDEAAAEMVRRFGYRHFDTGLLLRLMNRLIRTRGYTYDKNTYNGVLSLYRRDVWDSVTLTYLCRHFNGSTEDMRLLLERAVNGEAVPYDLPERLLGQMLFTGETRRIEWVVEQYLKENQAPKVPNRVLLHAYAVDRCERYFCRGETIPDNIFAYLASWALAEKKPVQLPDLCQIALTRYYADKESLTPEETSLAKTFLYHLYDKGLLFAYQEKLGRFFSLPDELGDKTLIEYRGKEEEPVRIAFRILPQEADKEPRISEMPHIFRGIYVKPVLVFADEVLEYTIYRSDDPERTPLQQGRLPGSVSAGGNRFASLNRLIDKAAKGEEGWQEELEMLGKRDVILQEYFPLS